MTELDNYVNHLRAFAEAFIDSKHIDRWVRTLVEKPIKAPAELAKFERHLNNKYCRLLESKDLDGLAEIMTNKKGVFFDGRSEPELLAVSEARTRALMECQDAIFSITPGREAVFFFHEGWGWHCKK